MIELMRERQALGRQHHAKQQKPECQVLVRANRHFNSLMQRTGVEKITRDQGLEYEAQMPYLMICDIDIMLGSCIDPDISGQKV